MICSPRGVVSFRPRAYHRGAQVSYSWRGVKTLRIIRWGVFNNNVFLFSCYRIPRPPRADRRVGLIAHFGSRHRCLTNSVKHSGPQNHHTAPTIRYMCLRGSVMAVPQRPQIWRSRERLKQSIYLGSRGSFLSLRAAAKGSRGSFFSRFLAGGFGGGGGGGSTGCMPLR